MQLYNVRSMVANKKYNKIYIFTSKNNPATTRCEHKEYANFNERIEKAHTELTNDITCQIQSCAHDYPLEYIGMMMISPEGHETIHTIRSPEI